jgi:hypothetical protein
MRVGALLEPLPRGSLRVPLAGKPRRDVHRRLAQSSLLPIDPVRVLGRARERDLHLVRATVTVLPLKGRLIDLAAGELRETQQWPEALQLAAACVQP